MDPGSILLTASVSAAVGLAFLYVVARGVAREERVIDLRFRIEKREREIETELRTRRRSK